MTTSAQLAFAVIFASFFITTNAFSTFFISACPSRGPLCSGMCSNAPDDSLSINVVSDLFTTGYEPGETYDITIEVSGGASWRGFLMSVYNATDEFGTFSTSDSKFDATGTNILQACSQSIRHADATDVFDTRTIQWTAPDTFVGPLLAQTWVVSSRNGPTNCVWKDEGFRVNESIVQVPTEAPTEAPTDAPTDAATDAPTNAPTEAPTDAATEAPTDAPTTMAPMPISSRIGDFVFNDRDGTGLQGINFPFNDDMITMVLLNEDGSAVVAQTTTDDRGVYEFNTADHGVQPDTNYIVCVDIESLLEQVDISPALVGSDPAIDSNGVAAIHPVYSTMTLSCANVTSPMNGGTDVTIDFGLIRVMPPPTTVAPTDAMPTDAPTDAATDAPTDAATDAPTSAPIPTGAPSMVPTEMPTDAPTLMATDAPTDAPAMAPVDATVPTQAPDAGMVGPKVQGTGFAIQIGAMLTEAMSQAQDSAVGDCTECCEALDFSTATATSCSFEGGCEYRYCLDRLTRRVTATCTCTCS